MSSAGKWAIGKREGSGPCQLSPGQYRLWFLHQLQPDIPIYNVSKALRVLGLLDLEALQRALNAVVARHEVLRTTFSSLEGVPMQVVGDPQPVDLRVIDLSSSDSNIQEVELRRQLVSEATRAFDLAKDLMLRALLVRLSPDNHVLQLVTHHIASDAWSMKILLRDLAALCTTFSIGKPIHLPELPIQYADFSVWQHDGLQEESLKQQLSYWKHRLEGVIEPIELPTDRPRPLARSYRGARKSLLLPASLLDSVKELSRREGVTVFMTLLAAFQALLHRYTGSDSITVGAPIAGRNRLEVENLVGFFVNTLVLHCDVAGDPSFRTLLHRVRETTLRAYSNQDVPFERLVEELRPERDPGGDPLFRVMFQLKNMPLRTIDMPGLAVSELDVDAGLAKYDLSLELVEGADGMVCTAEYSTDIFDESTIGRMLGHYRVLLEAVVADPEQRVRDVPILTEGEKHQLLVEWNETARDYPRDQRIHQLFEAQVARDPEAIAIEHGRERLTYRELDARANQVGHYLRTLGVGPEVLVGLCVERSLEMVVGMLGILKAGGAYVPLDPGYPRQRLEFMVEDAGLKVLLTQKSLKGRLPDCGAIVVGLDAERAIEEESCDPLENHTALSDPAYVMYTSGSTGTPKGVVVPHRAVLRLLFGVDYVRLDAHQTILQLAPVTFDASTFEIWGALLHGGRCVLFPGRVPTPDQLEQAIEEHGITTLWLTSSLFNSIMDAKPGSLSGVRQLLTGGEALSVNHVRRALRHLPSTLLVNGYGPTEGTTFTCCFPIPRSLHSKAQSIPIGKPIGNTKTYILDNHLQLVPVGIRGELYIGGDGLATGYLNSPELTAERFIPNPFTDDPGARLFRTGDLVRYLSDGNIEFLGRIDHQVKIRGFRIELGEIEATLGQHPGVREAIVVAREDSPGDKRLVGYVVPQGEGQPTAASLRSFLAEKLPEYMVPSALVLLERLPLTPNGKVDRSALPAPQWAREESSYVPPSTPLEKQLARIWADLLGIDRVGINDNFFDLGGHSLLAVHMFAEMERIFGKRLPLAALFEGATVRHLARRLSGETRDTDHIALVPIRTSGSGVPLFCVHGVGGEVLFYHALAEQLGPGQPVYGLQAWGLDGKNAPHYTIEEAAAAYIRELHDVQPRGPYFLVGFSSGGVWAYEIACQLRAAGEHVELLALIDSGCPAHGQLLPAWERIRRHLVVMRTMTVKGSLRYALARTETIRGRLARRSRRLKGERLARLAAPSASAAKSVTEANWLAFDSYSPRPYPGSITLFWAKNEPLFSHFAVDPRTGWSDLAEDGVETHEVDGDHASLIREPAIRELAERLKTCLTKSLDTDERDGKGPACGPKA